MGWQEIAWYVMVFFAGFSFGHGTGIKACLKLMGQQTEKMMGGIPPGMPGGSRGAN